MFSAPPASTDTVSDVVRIPTSEAQQELWTATQLGSAASLAFNEAIALALEGPLDRTALDVALAGVLERHEALRTRCAADGRALEVDAQHAIVLEHLDWTTLSESAQQDALRAHEQALVETPFNLTDGPLVRVTLAARSATSHVLTIAAHHIVCDGWSFGVIARELGALYTAQCTATDAALPEPDHLEHFTELLADEAHGPEMEAAEAYWVQRFQQEVPPLELPTVHMRPPVRRFEAGRVDLALEADLVTSLRAAAARDGSTLFATMLTGFVALLHRLGSLDDLVVGIPTAGQARLGLTRLVGHCVNLLPLRVHPQPEQAFAQLHTEVRRTLFDALDHQQLTFGALLTRLPIARDPSRLPLVNVAFNVDRGLGDSELGFHALSASFRTVPRTHENFELFLNAVELGDTITLELQYSRALFDEDTITRWLGSYGALLAAAAEAPDTPVGRLPILTAADRALLAQFQFGPVVPVDESRLVHDRVREVAARLPDAVAASSGNASRTYAALEQQANRIARDLRARGVRRDVPVGVLLPRDVRLPETIIGVLRAGGAYMPLDPDLPLARLHFLVRDAQLAHVITASTVRALLPDDVDLNVLDLDADLDQLAALDPSPLAPSADDAVPESISFVIYTSGSTGIPKGCCNTHRGLLNFACSNSGQSGPTEGSIVMALAASGFDASVGEITMALSLGAHIVIAPRDIATDGVRLVKALEETNATLFFGSPATFQLLFAAGWRGHAGMTVVSGGETLTRDLAGALAERAGAVWNVYGPTEAAVWVSRSLVSPVPPRIPIGAPMANSRFDVVDAYGVPVPVGIPGELFIAGPNVGRGYLNRDALTAERFLPDPHGTYAGAQRYRTGDVVRWLGNGELEFIGRNDDQVKLRGFRIELGEIASRLEELPEVAAAIAMVRTSEDGDRRLLAYVQRAPGAAPDDSQLRKHLAAQLPSYMVPQAFVMLDAFPLLATGKVNRRALPAPADRSVDDTRAYRAPETPMEQHLAAAWARALRVARVSADDDFFELGGHSLLASQVLAQLRTDHGLDVPYRLFFEAPTVARLAAAVEALQASGHAAPSSAPIVPRLRSASAPVSITQRRLYMLEALDPTQRLVLAHGAAWRLHGPLDADRLEQALADVIARHDTLRTRFELVERTLRQIVEPSVPFTLRRLDVSARAESDRESAMLQEITDMRAQPFDHTVPPLFRALLTRFGPTEHVLFTQQHGLIWDGWSFDVFLDDLTAAYAARRDGSQPAWAPLAIQYADFAEWQAEHLQSPAMARQVAWWRGHLGESVPVLELPTDFPRPTQPSFEGGRVQLRLESDEVEQLRRAAQREGATLFQLLFTAFHVLLHRYSGQRELVVATPLRNRSRSEVAHLIGPFTNTVAVRSRIAPDARFADILRAVRADCVQALEHEEMPFELLERQAPAVRALFSMQDARSRPRDLDGCRIDQVSLTDHTATNDLMLWTMEYPSSLLMVLSYRSDLFEDATAHMILEQFRSIVREAAADPGCLVQRLAMHADSAELLDPTSAPPDEPIVLRTALARAGTATRDVAWNRRGTVARTALLEFASRMRSALIGHGLHAGDLVLCRTHDDSARVALQLAALHAGVTLISLCADDSDDYVRTVASSAAVALIVTDRLLEHSSAPTMLVSALLAAPVCAEPETTHEAVAARIAVTASGNTLQRVPLAALEQAVVAAIDALALTSHDTLLDLATAADEGPPVFALAALACDARRVGSDDARSLEGDEIIELLDTTAPTVIVAYEDAVRELERAGWSGHANVRVLVVGECEAPRLAWLQSRVAEAHVGVGIAETLGLVARRSVLGAGELPLLRSRRARVLDRDERTAPRGVRGTLALSSTARDDAASGWQHTTVAARRRADGTITIRPDTGNARWIAGAIRSSSHGDHMVRDAAGASDAAMAWHEDATGHVRLVAYLVGRNTRTDADVRRHLRAQLPSWAMPASFVTVDALPRTADGHVDTDALPNPWQRADATARRTAPETPAERMLASLWCELLEVANVRVGDNFFALGGHSLLCFRLIERVQEHTGYRLNPRTLLFGTLERVAEELQQVIPSPSTG